MNETLSRFIEIYATQGHDQLLQAIEGTSKPTLGSALIDLITMYLNDVNSSTLREWLTLKIAGYEPSAGKLGYNGYRHAAPDGTSHDEFAEAKPVNVRLKGDDQTPNRRLNGGGNFSDYTPERLQKDLGANLNVLVSGFVEGKLIYVFEFPFKCLENRLTQELKKAFKSWNPQDGNWTRPSGRYARSVTFSIDHYKECVDEIRVHYLVEDIEQWKNYLSRNLYKFIKDHLGSDTPTLF